RGDREPNFAQPRLQPRMLAAQLSEASLDVDRPTQMPSRSPERSEDAQDHVQCRLLAGRMGGPGIERRWSRRAARPQSEKSFAYDGHTVSDKIALGTVADESSKLAPLMDQHRDGWWV